MRVYGQLRSLQGSDQSGVAENVAWKRDAGTFTSVRPDTKAAPIP